MSDFGWHVLDLDYAAAEQKICARLREITARMLHRRGLIVAISGGIDSSVCAALAVRALGAERVFCLVLPERDSDSDSAQGTDRATWAIVTTNEDFLKTPEVTGAILSSDEHNERKIIWTDDYGSLWQVLEK